MANNLKQRRWVAVFLVTAVLLPSHSIWAAEPAAQQKQATAEAAKPTPQKSQKATPASAASAEDLQQLQAQIQATQNETRELERKTLDGAWQALDNIINWVGVLFTIFGVILGIIVPVGGFLLGRSYFQEHKTKAEEILSQIQAHEKESKRIIEAMTEGKPSPRVVERAEEILSDPKSLPADKLWANAVQASSFENPSKQQAETAYELWLALTKLESNNAEAHFYAGVWLAAHLAKQSDSPQQLAYLLKAQQAFAEALRINPKFHEAAYGWGSALLIEYLAIKATSPAEAAAKLQQAQELLEKHSHISEEGKKKAAYLLAWICALQGKNTEAITQLETARQSGTLPKTEAEIWYAIRQMAEFKAWWQQHFGGRP